MPKWTSEQLDAINKDGSNIIVSAGAGSGKTAVLSERVLRKLKDGVSINNLLILTFTKAAAAEMKERIRKKIFFENITSELDKIDNAYITTFDSYALSIVKKYGYLINVSKNISIIDPSIVNIKKGEIIDLVFEQLYHEQDSDFLKLIDDFCTKDDEEIKKMILNINSKLDMIYQKEQYLDNYINIYYNDDFISNKIKDYENLLINILGNINSSLRELQYVVDSEYFKKISDNIEELIKSNTYDSIKFNIPHLPNLPKNSLDEAKKIKDEITHQLNELRDMCIYENKDEISKSIYKTKSYVLAIIKVIKSFDEKLNLYKSEYDLYEFNDVAKMAIKILDEYDWVKDEIKNSLNEILIDEYQDTNDLQDLFISKIENNNVYMVGDIKQSIYRFRNANPNLFKSKYYKYSNLEGGIKIDLNKNFRSREEVLSNINLIFNYIMDINLGGADYKNSHNMIFGNDTYNSKGKTLYSNNMEIYNYPFDKNCEYRKEEIEIFIIANDIKSKIEKNYKIFDKDTLKVRNIKYSDIAILLDKSVNFNLYKKIFEFLNIPLTIYKDESITENIDISIIKNIINLIINKTYDESFKYSFISVLRSYLFNMDDNEIFKYFLNNNYSDSILLDIISSINFNNLSCYELLLEIIDKFDFYNKIITVADIKNHIAVLDYLVEISKQLSKMGYTIYEFYDYLDKILNNSYDITLDSYKNPDAVKIMTIHKSKGLEFNICYYAGLYSKFNISDLKEKLIYDNDIGIITPYLDNGIKYTIYKYLLKNNYLQDEISEKLRLFYVALTRAKEKMIIVAPLNEENLNFENIVPLNERLKYTSFLTILNSIKSKISEFVVNIDLNNLNLTHDYNFIKGSNYKNNMKIVEDTINVNELNIKVEDITEKHFSKNDNKLINIEDVKKIKLGRHIHSIFENIDFLNPSYNELSVFESKLVKSFIESGILDNVINIYKEYEFIYTKDNIEYHGIIDLLLEYKDEFKIIDYKLKNTNDEAYLKQLMGYREYIKSITNKTINVYLYSILDMELINITKEEVTI